ncbi:MAG TPA: DUF58 domain-containing protein [Bryobacteraceae bacterium]|nr:DUF58 domain-containing protein [Bryobacteraceae bacterium]
MRIRWQIVRRLLSGPNRYRITKGGALFTLGMLLAGLGAVVSANNLLFLILAAMMATLLVSGMISRLCLAALDLDFLVPEHVCAGRKTPGRLIVRNEKWLIPSFSIRVEAIPASGGPVLESAIYFPLVKARTAIEATVDVRFPKRGTYRQNSFAFSTAFPFGFLQKSARVTLRRDSIVYPSIDPRPGFEEMLAGIAGEIETHYRGLGKDFYRIRPYEAFESARHVDWKATAHVGALQIREFAREQEQTVEIFLDRDIPPEMEDWFETAVECCAFLAWELSNRGTGILFRSQGIHFRTPQEGDIYTILRYLAIVYPQRRRAPEAPLEDSTYKIVVTPYAERFQEAGWRAARVLGPANF